MRQQIDLLLHQNAVTQANLGSESTEEEKEEARKKDKVIKDKISELDAEFADFVFPEI